MKESPSKLSIPSYLMNFPFTVSTKNPNNIWMKELKPEELEINRPKAYKQFMDLYNFMAGSSLVYLLPSNGELQDQVYVANLGLHLPHLKDEDIILLSNFTSEPRKGEEWVGKIFFDLMEYETYISPRRWEGEADLKYLRDNIYIGGYGIRTEIETYDWMKDSFDMNIIKLKMVDEYLYHLDCSVFPVNNYEALICTELYDPAEISMLEEHLDIIDINIDDAYSGITNSVRMGNMILCASNISELKKTHEHYDFEKNKIATLERICSDKGMEPVIFNLSEFMKSGAMLSCCVMHLNRADQNKQLI